MLGPPKLRRLDQPIAVSLENLVPADNFYRHLEAKLDLTFVRDWTQALYAERGRPSIDPVVFFKLQLILFFEGLRAARQLIATARLNLAHRWRLGYALDESVPDHSSLTRIRRRLGIDVFPRCFEQIVDLCQEAGLVWGKAFFFDATKVAANADLASRVPRFFHAATAHVADRFAKDAREIGAETEPAAIVQAWPATLIPLPRATGDEAVRPDPPPWKRLEERRLDPDRPASGSDQRTTNFRVNLTDPDAAPMRAGSGIAFRCVPARENGRRTGVRRVRARVGDEGLSRPRRAWSRTCVRRGQAPGGALVARSGDPRIPPGGFAPDGSRSDRHCAGVCAAPQRRRRRPATGSRGTRPVAADGAGDRLRSPDAPRRPRLCRYWRIARSSADAHWHGPAASSDRLRPSHVDDGCRTAQAPPDVGASSP